MRANVALLIGVLAGGCSGGGGGGPTCQMESGACGVSADCCGQLACVGGACTSSQPGCKSLNFICLAESDCCSPLHCVNNMCSMASPPDGGGMQEGASCDLVEQNCTDPNLTKCAAVDDGSGTNYLTGKCVAPSGGKMADEVCTRANNTEAGVGFDDCAKGEFCSVAGANASPPNMHCHKFCGADGDCGTGERCIILVLTAGICVATCPSPISNGCAAGLTCANVLDDYDSVTAYFGCRAIGAGKEYDTCATDTDCGAGMGCLGRACLRFCNPNNGSPCRVDQACDLLNGGAMFKPTFGVCKPF